MTTDRLATLRHRLEHLLVKVDGQYARPWMLSSCQPTKARVFIVGHQWAKRYPADDERLHERYLHSHWSPEPCRRLYDDVTGGDASPTRREQDSLVEGLRFADVLETNVICMSRLEHGKLSSGSVEHGREIFRTVLDVIRPRVVIMYGAETIKEARRVGFPKLSTPKREAPDPIGPESVWVAPVRESFEVKVITMLSLGQPGFNHWKGAWPRVREQVIEMVRAIGP